MMTTNLFVIANVKQLRTGGSFRILLPFFRTSWGVGFLNSAIFNSFHIRVEFGMIMETFGISDGESLNPSPPPPRTLLPVAGHKPDTSSPAVLLHTLLACPKEKSKCSTPFSSVIHGNFPFCSNKVVPLHSLKAYGEV